MAPIPSVTMRQAVDDTSRSWHVRPLGIGDVDGIMAVQARAYEPRYHESPESFSAKLAAGVGCCRGVFAPDLVAYVVALPCHPGFVMPLDAAPRDTVPLGEASCLYVHDLAVDARWRGQRLGDVLWAEVQAVARRHRIGRIELTSVQNSVAWWHARGFEVTGSSFAATEGNSLAGYGPEAVRMHAPVALETLRGQIRTEGT